LMNKEKIVSNHLHSQARLRRASILYNSS
jgi:hypothetical protein